MTLMIFIESEFWDGYHKNALSSPLEKKREKWRTYNIGKRLVITLFYLQGKFLCHGLF
jgi:hypothetical protein